VGAAGLTTSGRQGRAVQLSYLQATQAGHCPHHVHQGVDGAYLVELDLVGRLAVDPALGFGEAAEDQRSPLAVGGGQVAPLNDGEDVG